MEKTCFKCGLTKDLSEFYVHPRMGDGHLNKCKECAKKDVHEREISPEGRKKIIAYEIARNKDPDRIEKRKSYVLKMRAGEIGRMKHRARMKYMVALRQGRIIKQPCEVCGKLKVEGHHTDYRSPLKVTWLCRKHHLEAENKIAY